MPNPPPLTAIAAAFALILAAGGASAAPVETLQGQSADGATWAIERPETWNGAVLLYARGYSPQARRPPATAPGDLRAELLARGYGLAASSYPQGGWAVEGAVPAQIAALDAFQARFGKPKRVIAWGNSMGGLVSIALAERRPDRIDGALPSCGSISGALGMMNQALDGAFAFKTLLAAGSEIRLTRIDDDMANGARARAMLAKAQETPEGRARIALAGVFAGLPAWSDNTAPEPAATDYTAQQRQAAKTFVMGVFFPRVDQETRAGGGFSWNTGVDYARQLQLSGRRAYVEALYSEAGLDLARDLAALNTAERVSADPRAIAYMRANYTPTGRLRTPVLSYHTTGDGMTMPNKQRAYGEIVAGAGAGGMFRGVYVRRAGHCTFTAAENLAALETLEDRLATGRWRVTPDQLNARVQAAGGPASFATHQPFPFMRPCSGREARCAGEPR